jgi:hypothetical protein
MAISNLVRPYRKQSKAKESSIGPEGQTTRCKLLFGKTANPIGHGMSGSPVLGPQSPVGSIQVDFQVMVLESI